MDVLWFSCSLKEEVSNERSCCDSRGVSNSGACIFDANARRARTAETFIAVFSTPARMVFSKIKPNPDGSLFATTRIQEANQAHDHLNFGDTA